MDRFKDLAKRGWHPEKDSGQSGGIKDQVKGWVGKGDSRPTTHYATSYEKKDPSSFPPPPPTKRYDPGEGPVAPPPKKEQPPLPPRGEPVPDPVAPRESRQFVANTTQTDTQKFPKPPPRNTGLASPQAPAAAAKPKPALPPRSLPADATNSKNPATGVLSQGALNRLGNAGISVPGFGISGAKAPPPVPPRSTEGTISPSAPASSTGTTWAEKQAALKTANSLRTNPGAISLSEIRSAAATAKNFQDRHGDQVATGLNNAQQANQKYGLAEKMAGLSVGNKPPAPAPPPKKFHGDPPALPLGSKPKPS